MLVRRLRRYWARAERLLEYIDPGRVVPVPLTVPQLVSTITGVFVAAGVSVDVERAGGAWAAPHLVRIDPVWLPRILEAMRTHVGPTRGLRLEVGTTLVGSRAALLVVLRALQPTDHPEHLQSRSFEWTIAERLVARLDGDIEALDVHGERVARLALPFIMTAG
jgi:hypothetical protein